MPEQLTMTTRELDRLRVVHQVLARKLTWPQAASQLGLSTRQLGRLCGRVRAEGHAGIRHRLRGRPSNHQLPATVLPQALALVRRHYPDFGPTFANEKLRQRHGLVLSTWTLRQGMLATGLWRPRRRRQEPHRAWRPRRACVGELIQLDGSTHAWFEERAPACVLLLYIDDATSRLQYAEFVAVEDTWTLFRSTRTYLERFGRPGAFYVDKDSIYRVNRQATIEEQLQDRQTLTQFTRAMRELEITVIPAHSPQAKGRVERSFDTHQDRLVKELRLAAIATREAGTAFVNEVYIPAHNAAFAVEPASATSAHRPLLARHRLHEILTIRTPRVVAQDWTLRCQNHWFQLLPQQPVRLRPGDRLEVEQRLDGSTHLRAPTGQYLAYRPIPKPPPRRPPTLPVRLRTATARPQPPTHPWKRSYKTILTAV
jgi:hypothetical protein